MEKYRMILVEVNVGGEASKSGVAPDALEELLLRNKSDVAYSRKRAHDNTAD